MINRILNKINFPRRLAHGLRWILGNHYSSFMQEANIISHETYGGIVFDTSTSLAQWRGKTHLTKEPSTINWINGFDKGDVLFDVGANIGVYSLYAAIKKQIKVYAFEPSPFNFSALCRNIVLNNVSHLISPFCLAFSNTTTLDYLYMSSTSTGAAHTGFQKPINEFGKPMNVVHAQATLGFTMDDFIKQFAETSPQHIKIDVDGAEAMVVTGAMETLSMPSLKSILIELPSRVNGKLPDIISMLMERGFVLDREDHPDGDTRLCNYILKRP